MKLDDFVAGSTSALPRIPLSLRSCQRQDTPCANRLARLDLDLFTKSLRQPASLENITFRQRSLRQCHGFTLLELLIALGLAMTVLGIMTAFFVNTSRSSTAQNAAAGAQQSARAGIEYIAYELRMAGLDPLQTAGAGIEEISATGNKLRFSLDRCNLPIGGPDGCTTPVPDGDVDDISERVTYVYDPASQVLRRCLYETAATFGTENSDGTCQPVLERVVRNPGGVPLLTFLDDADTAITADRDRGLIRSVILTLTTEEPAGQMKKVARTYSARVRLRNIGL
ncbi:MAG: prepilin-type N-terminal cleavage/methylation domain-containing protein [Hyphomicrobiales bacterium]